MDESLESFFTNEEYDIQRFQIADTRLYLKTLSVATTDFDLTGQVIWPGARILAEFLAKNPEIATRRSACVEIGSGLGLVGLIAAKLCDTILTDHNETVLRVLRENAVANPGSGRIRCEHMDWESTEQVDRIRQMSPSGAQGFELVLGADICYGLKALPFIFGTYAALLSPSPRALGLLGYVSRAAAIDRGLLSSAHAAGLVIKEVEGQRQSVGGGLEGTIYELRRSSGRASGTAAEPTLLGLGAALIALVAAVLLKRTRSSL